MPSFVESATLKVVDQSTGPIRKINNELKKLFKTANQLKNMKVGDAKDMAASAAAARKMVAATKQQADAHVKARRAYSDGVNQQIRDRMRLMRMEQASAREVRANAAAENRAFDQRAKWQEKIQRAAAKNAAVERKAQEQLRVDFARGQVARERATDRAYRNMRREADTENRRFDTERNRQRAEAQRTANASERRAMAAQRQAGAPGVAATGGNIRELITGLIGANLITAIGHQIREALVEGTKQYDVGRNKLLSLQLDRVVGAGTENAAFEAIKKLGINEAKGLGGAFLNEGQRMSIFAEALGTTSLDTRGAALTTSALEHLVRTGVALGQSMDKATDQAYAYAKAADMMGRMAFQHDTMIGDMLHERGSFRWEGATDLEKTQARARGMVTPDLGAKGFFDYMQKIQPEIGKEFTGEFVRGIAKYLGATRFGVGDRAFGATLLLGEEMGTRAAVGYRQAVKQLSGIEQTKDRLATLADLGLIDFKKGGTKKRPKIIGMGAVDPGMMAQDLPLWINKHIYEGQGGERYSELHPDKNLRGRLIDKSSPLAKIEQKLGRAFNLDFIEDVQELARRLVGNQNAIDTLTSHLYNSAEIQKKLAQVDKRDPEAVRQILMQSPTVAANQLKNQFQGVMGAAVVAAGPVLTPIMQGAAEALQKIGTLTTTAFGKEGPEKASAQKQLEFMAGSGLLLTPVVSSMTRVLGPILGQLTEGIGYGAGLMAMMDPKTAPMGAAAVSLMKSSSMLMSAAQMLGFAAKGDLTGLAGAAAMMTRLGIGGLSLYALTEGGKGIGTDNSPTTAEHQNLIYAETQLKRELIEREKELRQATQDYAEWSAKGILTPEGAARMNDTFDRLNDRIGLLKQAIENNNNRLRELDNSIVWPPSFKPADELFPKPPKDWRKTLGIDAPTKDIWKHVALPTPDFIQRQLNADPAYRRQQEEKARRGQRRREPAPVDPFAAGAKNKPIKFINPTIIPTQQKPGALPWWVSPQGPTPPQGFPKATPGMPGTVPEATPPGSILLDMVRRAMTEGGLPMLGDATVKVESELKTDAQTIKDALTTGASAVAAAGTTAAGAMQGAAPGIGGAIASAFVAGASGLKIGVDLSGVPSGGKTNAGAQDTGG